MVTNSITELGITCWNINNFQQSINRTKYNKLHNPNVLDILTKSRIFGLIETHHTDADIGSLHVQHYKCHSVCRPKSKNVKRFKPSGGLAIYVHTSISQGVAFMSEPGTESMFLQLKKDFFNLSKDIYICFAYMVPSTSKVLNRDFMPEDIFDDLSSKLAKYRERGEILILGDFNSRIKDLSDFIPDLDEDQSGLSNSYRSTMDQARPTGYGRRFIDLCHETPLRILNGRFLGDFMGNFTCFRPQGMSVVDYGAASPDLLCSITSFSVLQPVPVLSDHCPISVNLKVLTGVRVEEALQELSPKPDKIRWVRGLSDTYTNILQSSKIRNILSDFQLVGIMPHQEGVDSANSLLTNILITAAKQAGMQLKKGAVPRRQARPALGFDKPRVKHPRWYGMSCHQAYQAMKTTASLLQKNPKNAWLRGKLSKESKEYKRVVKLSQKTFVDSVFKDLEAINRTDPKGYMDLVQSLRQGRFDKKMPSDTAGVAADTWFDHFHDLLGRSMAPTADENSMQNFTAQNADKFQTELDKPFCSEELKNALKRLKNNKASSFDQVCNEMLKNSGQAMENALLLIFNTCLSHSLVASEWRKDLLQPLFKSGIKTDPNNFRGVCVSSCLGKLLNSLLRYRLEKKCAAEGLIPPEQASGQEGARTSDHLLILHHLIQKYAKNGNKLLYVCYIDLQKAFDSCNRIKLLYELVSVYKIGGKFLGILQSIYESNLMYIKLDGGVTKPFFTTVGCKQGCNLSSILFNLFIGRLPTVFDEECQGVDLDGRNLNCLLWADDCVLISQSSEGLQRAIDKTAAFFTSQGLSLNIKKTKCMIFNKSGRKAKAFQHLKFSVNGRQLSIVDEYVYLGLTFVPSGSFQVGMEALCAKASRAYFSIANILYTNRRMPVQRAMRLADSLVFPVSYYASDFLTPLVLPGRSYSSQQELLRAWQAYKPELTNQRMCRLLLSVHKKASRLPLLGDLGRYPLLVAGLANSVTYSQVLYTRAPTTLVRRTLNEMENMVSNGQECWLTKVNLINKLLCLKKGSRSLKPSNKTYLNQIKSKFDIFFLDEINDPKIGPDGRSHNKLCFYASLKGSFKPELYIEKLHNRSQRAELCRIRVSAHRLGVELGRRTVPITPLHRRTCKYCPVTDDDQNPGNIDDEYHLFQCPTFANKQRCLFARIAQVIPNFDNLSFEHKVRTMLCPINTQATKIVNKYIKIIFNARTKLDEGHPLQSLTFPPDIFNYQAPSSESSGDSSESASDSDSESEEETDIECEL